MKNDTGKALPESGKVVCIGELGFINLDHSNIITPLRTYNIAGPISLQ
jgi:hypothetical protein